MGGFSGSWKATGSRPDRMFSHLARFAGIAMAPVSRLQFRRSPSAGPAWLIAEEY
jgi:hypothetical protein